MDIEKVLKAYEIIDRMDGHTKDKIKARVFLQRYPHLQAAIREYAYDHYHSGGQEEVESATVSLGRTIWEALVQDGVPNVTEEEFLLEVITNEKGEGP